MYICERFPSCDVYINLFDDKGERLFDLAHLNEVLAQKANIIKRYAYAVVSEDENSFPHRVYAPEESAQYVNSTYIYMILQFLPQCPQCKPNVASWFNIPEEKVYPHRDRFDNYILYLTNVGVSAEEKALPEGITANFDVQSAINYAIEQKKLEYIFESILCGDDRRLFSCSEVEKIRNRLLSKTQPFFDSPDGQGELESWISHVLYNTPF